MPELAAHLERVAKEVAGAIARDAVRLAIMRSELTWDADAENTEEEIAEDAAWALVGEGTCSEEPMKSVKALAAALAACAREEAKWWHQRVHYAAMEGMLDVEWEALKHETRQRIEALERAVGEKA